MWKLSAACLCVAASLRAFQPEPAAMRKLFEDALARREHAYGDADAGPPKPRAISDCSYAARRTHPARRAMAHAIQLDEKSLGPNASQTLEDVATLATISPRPQAEPLLKRAAESTDPVIAGPSLTSLAEMRRQAGDVAAAALLLRRALEKAEAADGPNGLTTALVLKALARVSPAKDAIPLLRRAISIEVANLGPGKPRLSETSAAWRLCYAQRASPRKPRSWKASSRFRLAVERACATEKWSHLPVRAGC